MSQFSTKNIFQCACSICYCFINVSIFTPLYLNFLCLSFNYYIDFRAHLLWTYSNIHVPRKLNWSTLHQWQHCVPPWLFADRRTNGLTGGRARSIPLAQTTNKSDNLKAMLTIRLWSCKGLLVLFWLLCRPWLDTVVIFRSPCSRKVMPIKYKYTVLLFGSS